MESEMAAAFIRECIDQFESSFKRLLHCVEQLDNGYLWWRPNDKMNSVGILVKHVCGNMRQWVITQINNDEDRRNRPQEFVNDDSLSKQDLISLATNLKSDFSTAINKPGDKRFMERRRIQGYEVTLMGAIFHALTHLEGHVGQMVLLTRIQSGDNYKILWLPQTEEQKSEWKRKD